MVGQISERARSYVRRRALDTMTSGCRIERVTGPTLNEATLHAISGSRVLVYEGICRIWEITGPQVVVVGEEDITLQSSNLSIPWNVDPVPIRDDEVLITQAPHDPVLVGKRYRILDTVKSGELRATRRFQVQGMQRSETWQRT